MSLPDYYKILQVQPDADTEAIQAAYRRLSRKYHPDSSDLSDANETMLLLNEAYEVLSNPEKRTAYDQERGLHEQYATPPTTSSQESTGVEHEQVSNLYEQPDIEEPFSSSVSKKETRTPQKWRTIIVIFALVIVGVLTYQYFRDQSSAGPATPALLSPVAQAQVVGPEATAQANPDSAQAQFELGNAYAAAGQWPEAQAAYQKAIELDPKFQSAYANLGVVYYQLEKLDLAASQYQKALELDPNDGDVAYNLGALYLQQALLNNDPPNPDLLQQAVDQLQRARALDPDLAEPYFSLGVAYNALNQKQEAIQAFETFLTRDSGQDPRASQEAQRYLDALRE